MDIHVQRSAPHSAGKRRSMVGTAALFLGLAVAGVAAAEPLVNVRATGVSVIATIGDDDRFVSVEASRVTVNGDEQLMLNVVAIDSLAGTVSCGLAIVPDVTLADSARTIGLRIDLSSVQWLFVCDDQLGAPVGSIDLTFTANGFFRRMTTGTTHEWLPTFITHSTGTSTTESATVTGQLLDLFTPSVTIYGEIRTFSSREITIERR